MDNLGGATPWSSDSSGPRLLPTEQPEIRDAKEAEEDDPLMIAGVAVPGDTQEAMAETFVEEFVRMGFDDERILSIFRHPHYVGANRIWVERGEAYVRELIARTRLVWR